MREWKNAEFNIAGIIADNKLFESYCRGYHNEQMCPDCYTFNMQGVTFCNTGYKQLDPDSSATRWTAMSIKDRLNFTNATLKPMVWKKQKHLRGERPAQPKKQRRNHARELYKSARRGARQSDGTIVKFEGCLDRFIRDELFCQRMEDDNALTQ